MTAPLRQRVGSEANWFLTAALAEEGRLRRERDLGPVTPTAPDPDEEPICWDENNEHRTLYARNGAVVG